MPEVLSVIQWLNSPYYQLLYNNNFPQRIEFIHALLQKLQPAADAKILYTNCGEGTFTNAISKTGLDVTGIDYSYEAVGQAQLFENDNTHFYQHDLRLPFWINYFHYSFNLFSPLGYFKTLREYDNCVRTISQSLHKDGMVIMDCINVHYQEETLENLQHKIVDGIDFSITHKQDDEYFYKEITVKDRDNICNTYEEVSMKLSIGDYTDMFAYQGLQIQEVYGDYNFAGYNIRKSPRLIFTAKKIR